MFYKGQKFKQHIIDLYGCNINLNDLKTIKNVTLKIIENYNLHTLKNVYYEFPEQGITNAEILSESHLVIHTWPEFNYATVDLFSCSKNLKIKVAYFKSLFECSKVKHKTVKHIL